MVLLLAWWSFVTQGFDRIEPGGVDRGEEARDGSQDGAERDGGDRGPAVRSNSTVPDDLPASLPTSTTSAPRTSPTTPPMNPMSADSATSSRTMRARPPPIARLTPISRVRSATDIAIVLMTDRPPDDQAHEGDADEDGVEDGRRGSDLAVEVLAVIVATSGTCASMRSASASVSVPGVG